MSKTIRIISAIEGFRRAGVAHSVAATDHPIDHFDEDQVKALQNEPKLIVRILDATADEARKNAIITAMQAMMQADPERKDKSLWTKADGRPDLKAVNAKLKEANTEAINANVRDEIWAEIKPA